MTTRGPEGGPGNPLPADTKRTEPKVIAATGGASAGVIVANFALWLIDSYALTPGHLGDVPGEVSLFVTLAVSAGLAFAAGRVARHQFRRSTTTPPELGY
jgi:hypothetical protein